MNRSETIKEKERINRRFEAKYFPKVEKALRDQISSLIEIIKRNGVNAGISEAQKIVTSPVAPVVQQMYMEVGLRYARKQWRDFQEQKRRARKSKSFEVKGFGFNEIWVRFIQDYLYKFLLDKVLLKVSEYTRAVLLNVLNKSIEEGWGIDKTVKELEELPLSSTQAARIVRTEITRAANVGQVAASETFEFEQTKEWIAAHDVRTRGQHPNDHASHIGLDGITIDFDDEFTDPINGDKLRHPGDPKASAASTVNCRCDLGIVAKLDGNGRLIPKIKKAAKEIEIEHKEEKEVDLTPIYELIREVKSDLSNQIGIVAKLNRPKEIDLTGVETRVDQIQGKIDEVMELVDDGAKDDLSVIKSAISEVAKKDNRDVNERIDGLIESIKGITVSPVVNVETNQSEVTEMIQQMGMFITEALVNLKVEMMKPRKWQHQIVRGDGGMIANILSTQTA